MTDSLSGSTWTELPDRPIVLVPLGSCEQHGPHLPFTTDTDIAEAVALAAVPGIEASTGIRVVVAPPLAYGASGEHQAFPGTVSIGHDALRSVLVELIRSMSTWATRIVLINGHGGNATTVTAVVDKMRYERHDVMAISCALETSTDAHAGSDETSLMLFLRQNTVRVDSLEQGNITPLHALLPDLMAQGVRPISPNGVLGDPRTASRDIGEAAFANLVESVVGEVCLNYRD